RVQALAGFGGGGGSGGGGGLGGLVEEAAHRELEDVQDLEERVEADLVLSALHPREIGLRDPDPRGEIRLRQVAALPQLTDPLPDEENLRRTRHGAHGVSPSKIRRAPRLSS